VVHEQLENKKLPTDHNSNDQCTQVDDEGLGRTRAKSNFKLEPGARGNHPPLVKPHQWRHDDYSTKTTKTL
jgi:hypothetical protein